MEPEKVKDAEIEQYEKARQELESDRERENPDGRLTGYELATMRNVIEGIRISPDGNIFKTDGIGDIKTDGYDSFKSKLQRNLGIIIDELEVLGKIIPKLSDEQEQQLKELNEKKSELARLNAGKSPDFDGDVTEDMIREAGNIEIYRSEIKNLQQHYSEALEANKKLKKLRDEKFKKRLAKCNFDLIHPNEIPPEVSTNERMAIGPMLYSGSEKTSQKEAENSD